jgi:hypothetical protein
MDTYIILIIGDSVMNEQRVLDAMDMIMSEAGGTPISATIKQIEKLAPPDDPRSQMLYDGIKTTLCNSITASFTSMKKEMENILHKNNIK